MSSLFSLAVQSIMNKFRRRLQNQFETGDLQPFDYDWQQRQDTFCKYEKLFANTTYDKQAEGGEREIILRDIIGRTDYANELLHGFYNPVQQICDAYQNVFRGTLGSDFFFTTTAAEKLEKDSKLKAALDAVWKESNLGTTKEVMQTWAPLYGTVGLRVTAVAAPAAENRRVKITLDHPGRIIDFDEDTEGNITAVELQWREVTGNIGQSGKGRRSVLIRQILNKNEFIEERDGKLTRTPNALGVCPYVLLRHRDVGGEFGINAFYGSEEILHLINWRMTRHDKNIDENSFPRWFAAAAGKAPVEFDLSGTKVAYVQQTEGASTPLLQALVAQIDNAGISNFWSMQIETLKARQPELVLYDLKALAGQSGETIAQLLKPVEDRILRARTNYEDALKRAMQIAVSWRVMFALDDVGTGSGNLQAAENAYRSGSEDFSFNQRPALPQSAFDIIKQAEADTARRTKNIADAKAAEGMVSDAEQLRIAGYSVKEIADIQKEKATLDVIPTTIQ